MKKKIFYNLLRILLTVIFLGIAYHLIDFKDRVDADGKVHEGFFTIFRRIDKTTYLLFFCLQLIPLTGIALRWWLILKSHAIPVSYARAFGITYAGAFFNNFLPGGIGGEVVKAFVVAKDSEKKAAAVGTVLLDHIIGLIALILMAAVVVTASLSQPGLREAGVIIYALLGGGLLMYLLYFSKTLRGAKWVNKLMSILPFQEAFKEVDGVLKSLGHRKKLMVLCLLLSFLIQSIAILATYGFARALSLDVAWHHMFIFMPIIWIINILPISYGGWGVGELAFANLFGLVGVPGNQAVALSVLNHLSYILVSIPGVLIFTLVLSRAKSAVGKGEATLPGSAR